MKLFQEAANTALFLDGLSELQENLLKMGDVPSDGKVYNYAVCFFTVLKNFTTRYKIDKIFWEASNRLSEQSMGIFVFKNWMNVHVRAEKNEKITMDKIYLSNPYVSLQDYATCPNQVIEQMNIKNYLTKVRNKTLLQISNILASVKRPNNLVLKIAGYNNQKIR